MSMKKITAKEIWKYKPCQPWTIEKIAKFLGKGKTLLEVLGMTKVEPEDRIWCVTRFLPDKTNRAFAIWCAKSCKTSVKEIKDYIAIMERYWNGKATEEELRAADEAAYEAAYWAADEAAYWAAYWAADGAAYWAADRAAYWAADRAAYGAAYEAADGAADWAAERQKQIEKLEEMIFDLAEKLV